MKHIILLPITFPVLRSFSVGGLLCTFAFLLSALTIQAQTPEFKVTSFAHQSNNLAARTNPRTDDNDQACALIQVRTAETGVGFTANTGVVGNVEWKNGEYWLYVSEGARSIKIFKQGIKTADYQLQPIPKSSHTYLMEVEVIRPKPKVAVIPVTIITTPNNANLTIDGKKTNNQTKSHKLSEGSHNILVEMPGYQSKQKTITVNSDNVYFTVELSEIANAALMVESEPKGATVYLDGVELGETPISAFYPAGTYPVKIVKEGYVAIENQTLTVTAPQTRKKYTLEENVGHITINTYEAAKVYINGQEHTNTKNIKFPPRLLNIRVTMPKAEDLEKQLVLKRNDKLNIDLFPDAATATLQVATTPFNANIELTGDAGEHFTATGMKIFNNVPIGNYTIKVTAEGYRTATKTITLTVNQVANQNIKLEEGPSGDIEMVFVKGGTFQMGSNEQKDEKPVHTVIVGDFYIGKYEVTNDQFITFLNEEGVNSSGSKNGTEYIDMDDEDCAIGYRNDSFYFKGSQYADSKDCPVIAITWYGAKAYCNWAGGRLPTEAEWEYAARGGNNSRDHKYSGSNNIGEVAWYSDNSGSKTHPVGTKKANELGIYDMSGNVWEWCSDWYSDNYYKKSPENNPKGASSGTGRVGRGGGWDYYASNCRVAYRYYWFPGFSIGYLGFRLALVP